MEMFNSDLGCPLISKYSQVRMADQLPKTNENVIAQQTQEKFEFYLLSLVFTLLALSIQTAKFRGSNIADSLELFGWLFLIVSGLTGLSRMEWVPIIRTTLAQQQSFEEEIFKLKELELQGQTELHVLEGNYRQPIPERIDNRRDAIKLLSPYIDGLKRKHYFQILRAYLRVRLGCTLRSVCKSVHSCNYNLQLVGSLRVNLLIPHSIKRITPPASQLHAPNLR
jgi:hypothetical protein